MVSGMKFEFGFAVECLFLKLQKKRLGNMSKDGYVNGYKLATKQDFDEFITQCEDTAGWNISYDSKDVKVWDMSVSIASF